MLTPPNFTCTNFLRIYSCGAWGLGKRGLGGALISILDQKCVVSRDCLEERCIFMSGATIEKFCE